MKKIQQFSKWLFIASIGIFAAACSSDNDDPTPEPAPSNLQQIIFNTNEIGDGTQDFVIRTKGAYILKKGTYVLKGWVYIDEGVTLTIEPGTIIKGDKATKAALITRRGGKLIAEGTIDQPIVFTSNQPKGSRKPGDWGGIILCGKAPNNAGKDMEIEGGPSAPHGGTDPADNSGVLKYVRIEFAGYPFMTDKEINGLTMGSIGSGTKIEYVQVSYSSDDSYEWFGGTVNCKYLVAYHGWDDDFDTDNGFSGKLQYLLGVRHPKIADTSLSNGFESDNNADGSSSAPITSAVFSNVTLVGSIGQDAAFQNTTTYIDGAGLKSPDGAKGGIFQSAMQLRRNSRLNCFNSVAIGYPIGLMIDNEKGDTQGAATAGNLKLQNIYFAGMTILGCDINKKAIDQLSTNGKDIADATKESFSSTFFKTEANKNKSFANIADLKLKQPNSLAASPNWGPSTGSPLLGAGLFTDALLQSGFDKVNYIGAFKSDADADNWMKSWTNFDPQNTTY